MDLRKFYSRIYGNFVKEYSFEFEEDKKLNFNKIYNELEYKEYLTKEEEIVKKLYNDLYNELKYFEYTDEIISKEELEFSREKLKKLLYKIDEFVKNNKETEEIYGMNAHGISLTIIKVKDKYVYMLLGKIFKDIEKVVSKIDF